MNLPNAMNDILLSSAYLAPVEYYVQLTQAERVSIEKQEYYIKQTYRNRCHIATANGIMALSIPVEKPSTGKALTRDIRISEHGDWQLMHWRSIESAYNSSPFFEYYKDDLWPFYEKKWNFLWDFNQEIQAKMIELLDIEPIIHYTSDYVVTPDGLTDLREQIHPKKPLLQPAQSYYQVFEQKFGFQAGLSIIDLLFNMGNESLLILSK